MNQATSSNVVQFAFAIYGVTGFKSVVVQGASVLKRMSAALNHIDRQIGVMRKERLPQDRKRFTPMDYNLERTYERAEKIILNIKDVMKRATPEEEIPLAYKEDVATLTTEEFLEKGGDTYDRNAHLFLAQLGQIEANAEAYFVKRRADQKKKVDAVSLSEYMPQLYRATNGIFGKEKAHIILSLATIRTRSENGSVVEAVQDLCREYVNSVKSFLLTDYVRDVPNREKLKARILEADRLLLQCSDVNVYHIGRLFADRTPAALKSLGKNETLPKVCKIIEHESRELLKNTVLDLCSPRTTFEVADLSEGDPNLPVA